jgi:hypothetical protein
VLNYYTSFDVYVRGIFLWFTSMNFMDEIGGSQSRKNNAFSIHICVQWEKTNFIFDIFCDTASPKLFQQQIIYFIA